MKKVLVAYFSLTGNTEIMARNIAEGVRSSGNQAVVRNMSHIKSADDVAGYDGYIFGSPTYYLDAPEPVKTFLFLSRSADLKGKLGGAFGSYMYDGKATKIILETMQYVYNMEPFELGALNLKTPLVETTDGMRACQAYGRAFSEKLGT